MNNPTGQKPKGKPMTTNNKFETILSLTAAEGATEFTKLTAEEQKALVAYFADQLDSKYDPQHVFKATEWDELDEDMPVTYAMYVKVDDTADTINSHCECPSDNEFDGDETFADYIESFLDGHIKALPDCPIKEGADCMYYEPKEFVTDICDGKWYRTFTDSQSAIIDKCPTECVGSCEANDGSTLYMWAGSTVIDGVQYNVTIYVQEELIKGIEDAGAYPWDKFEYDIHFGGFVD